MTSFKKKTFLITGGLSGIGYAIAKRAAKESCKLILVQRREAQDKVDELKSLGALDVLQLQKDLSDLTAVKGLANEVLEAGHEVDVLINNAGLLTGGLIEEQDPDAISDMLNVNLRATVLLSQGFIPYFVERGKGKIVNNASVSGYMSIPCASTYAASKAGVVAFTDCIRQELRGTGVSTLLLVTPGVKTDMYDDISTQYGKHLDLSFLKSIPAEKWADQVWKALEADREVLKPSGTEAVGVWLAKHMPSVFERSIRSSFKRKLK